LRALIEIKATVRLFDHFPTDSVAYASVRL
jgi:hypothetical protein